MAQLDLFGDRRPRPDDVPGLVYTPDFLGAEAELELLREVDARPWLADLRRRVQHYGYRYDYKSRSVSRSMYLGPLPGFALGVAGALVAAGLLVEPPDQLIVNEYLPGQGIAPHIDCVPCFKDRIASVSLGSACEFELTAAGRDDVVRHLVLERRSALLLSGPARYDWFHAIRGRLSDRGVQRERRVSLTFRSVILD